MLTKLQEFSLVITRVDQVDSDGVWAAEKNVWERPPHLRPPNRAGPQRRERVTRSGASQSSALGPGCALGPKECGHVASWEQVAGVH